MATNINIGAEFFREIRENKCAYVDKTAFIEKLLTTNLAKVTLITRPRRFGKTLALTTLQDFFDISKQSKDIFDGLSISGNKELCDIWMNKYPTIFISLKSVVGKNFNDAFNAFKGIIVDIFDDNFSWLPTSQKISNKNKEIIQLFMNENAEFDHYKRFFSILSRSLYSHYNKPVILLIDEYDVPLEHAKRNNYYDEMVEFIRSLLGNALKTNINLKFAVLTGCLRIAKESIFTGLNNFKCYGIGNELFSDSFGFTNNEVDTLLQTTDLSDKKPIFQKWYDGYLFGKNNKIYCPWDVLLYISDLQVDPDAAPQPYWMNTSGNSIVLHLLKHADPDVREKFETLLEGGCIPVQLSELQTYNSLTSSGDTLWNILYLTGYLTRASDALARESGLQTWPGNCTALCLPNREIREVLLQYIKEWLRDTARTFGTATFLKALWAGDEDTVTTQLSQFLLRTISYHDDEGSFYHGLVVGLLGRVEDTILRSNREAGFGRYDILFRDVTNRRCAIIEIKQTSREISLQDLAKDALNQIEQRRYDAEDEAATLVHWGFAFHRKRCVARCAEARSSKPA